MRAEMRQPARDTLGERTPQRALRGADEALGRHSQGPWNH